MILGFVQTEVLGSFKLRLANVGIMITSTLR